LDQANAMPEYSAQPGAEAERQAKVADYETSGENMEQSVSSRREEAM
jgi:hypothetical protein